MYEIMLEIFVSNLSMVEKITKCFGHGQILPCLSQIIQQLMCWLVAEHYKFCGKNFEKIQAVTT